MRFIRREIKANLETVREAFLPYAEGKPSLEHFLLNDDCSRVGLHAFVYHNKITGYYESGQRSRSGGLVLGKSRFRLSLKSKGEVTVVRGLATIDALLLTAFLGLGSGAVFNLFTNPSLETIAIFLLCYFLLFWIYSGLFKETKKLYDEIQTILNGI